MECYNGLSDYIEKHITSLAGQDCRGWLPLPHLLQGDVGGGGTGGIGGKILLEVLLPAASRVLSSFIGVFTISCCSFTKSL